MLRPRRRRLTGRERGNDYVFGLTSGGVNLSRAQITWLAIGGAVGLVFLLTFTSFAGTFLFGLFFYYATRPVYDRVRDHVPRDGVAAALSLLALAVPILLLLAYTVLVGLQEFDRFTDENDLGEVQNTVESFVGEVPQVRDPQELLRDPGAILSDPSVRNLLETSFSEVLTYLGFLGNAAFQLFVMVVIAYYLLKDGRRLSRWAQSVYDDETITEFARDVDDDLQSVFFGNMLNSFLTAILAAIVYSLLNVYVAPAGVSVPFPALVGLLMAPASLIPVVGILAIYVPVGLGITVDAYLTDPALLWFPALFFVVSFVVIGAMPDFVLRPYVAAGSLHNGAITLAYTFGPLLFGWYGIFLGPVVLVLATHFARVVVPDLLGDATVEPYAVDPVHAAPGDTADSPVAVDGGGPTATGPESDVENGETPGRPSDTAEDDERVRDGDGDDAG